MLLTHDHAFTRAPGLAIENWAAPRTGCSFEAGRLTHHPLRRRLQAVRDLHCARPELTRRLAGALALHSWCLVGMVAKILLDAGASLEALVSGDTLDLSEYGQSRASVLADIVRKVASMSALQGGGESEPAMRPSKPTSRTRRLSA